VSAASTITTTIIVHPSYHPYLLRERSQYYDPSRRDDLKAELFGLGLFHDAVDVETQAAFCVRIHGVVEVGAVFRDEE
jgi:hypothetical protein